MAQREELRLSLFRADLLKILGEIYSELAALRKTVRPARLLGEGPVEDLMELIARLIVDCELNEAATDMMGGQDKVDELAQRLGPR